MPKITLTGADEKTPVDSLVRLVDRYPRVEIGLLYTETSEGRNRYPSKKWLKDTVSVLRSYCALHVCGSEALRNLCEGWQWMHRVGRIQINRPKLSLETLQDLSIIYGANIITQWSHNNTSLVDAEVEGHCLLVDSSGGRGISPEKWERPVTRKPVGFAGGLGSDNLRTELPKIMAVAEGTWWVDMEGKLRTEDDWFSVDLAECAIETFMEVTRL
jgi:hypothetical protein